MSAWLIFAMMGIYPDCPGDMDYQICSPVFDKVTINLNMDYYKGEKFVIESENNSKENHFIKEIKWNDKPYNKYSIDHNEIVNGGELVFEMEK